MSIMAMITSISKGSLHDGPGVRTVIYLKGCPLRCRWCHNPETWTSEAQTVYNPTRCIGCGRCISICPAHHSVEDGRMRFLREGCRSCGACAEVCPAGAIEVIGERKSADEVFDEIRKDLHYYRISGGGVTFSGGECLLYPDFVAEVAGKCRAERIHTAIESALCVPWENIETVLQLTDLFFADLKLADPQKHREYTGRDNTLILQNLQQLSSCAKEVIIRIPLIPQVNDSESDMESFAEIIDRLGHAVTQVELLKYNYLAGSKYGRLGLPYISFGECAQSKEQLAMLTAVLQRLLPARRVCCDLS